MAQILSCFGFGGEGALHKRLGLGWRERGGGGLAGRAGGREGQG